MVGELKRIEGASKIRAFSARDEALYLADSQHIIKAEKNEENDKLRNKVRKDCEPEVYDMYRDAVEQEKEWAEYLFKDGSMIGLNEKLLANYVECVANRRMKAIGLDTISDIPAKNKPLPRPEHWHNSNSVQVAPHEQ